MFYKLPLTESFRYVATPEDWVAFCAYGEVTSTDLWISSMAAGSGTTTDALHGYEILWRKLAAAVKVELLAGHWVAEGFVPGKDPHPVAIDPALWRKLEFDIFEHGAAGAGFEFVNVLLSKNASSQEFSLKANATYPLSQVLDHVATPEEVAELSRLRRIAPRPRLYILGVADPAYELACRQVDELEDRLWSVVRSHLLARTYVAKGLMKGGHEIGTIQAELWNVLRCRFWCDEASTLDGDLVFSHLTIHIGNLPSANPDKVPGTLRRDILAFLREHFASGVTKMRKKELLKKARASISPSISDTMFHDVWKSMNDADEIPELAVYRGRPPRKATDV